MVLIFSSYIPANKSRKSTSSSKRMSKVESEISSQASAIPIMPKDIEDFRLMSGYGHIQIFTYNELSTATKGFRPDLVIGEGGFGFVYKGVIDELVRPGFPETHVAVKELNCDSLQGDKEWLVSILSLSSPLLPSLFLYYWLCDFFYIHRVRSSYLSFVLYFFTNFQTEVNFLGQFKHKNLVKLVGYCCENEHRLLVYEYMASGSLDKHLFSSMPDTFSSLLMLIIIVKSGVKFPTKQ